MFEHFNLRVWNAWQIVQEKSTAYRSLGKEELPCDSIMSIATIPIGRCWVSAVQTIAFRTKLPAGMAEAKERQDTTRWRLHSLAAMYCHVRYIPNTSCKLASPIRDESCRQTMEKSRQHKAKMQVKTRWNRAECSIAIPTHSLDDGSLRAPLVCMLRHQSRGILGPRMRTIFAATAPL